jgi:putative N6-adenine-specific DNA methylase
VQKRIKRHVRGRSREFFVAAAPELIKLCYDELMALALPLEHARVVSGGIEIKGRLPVCYLANLHLRTANRILMRLDHFAATNFRQLGKKIVAFPWELYLYAQTPLTFHVTAKHSRLYHTDAISDIVRTGIADRLDSRGMPSTAVPADGRPQQIFVRVVDDQFLISIDSSGTNLYKRGLKLQGGPAPLRETLASAVLTLAGYDGATILLDPMCGTGTFTLEAAMRAAHIPAGWYRTFAFMQWPAFSPGQWDYLKKKAGENIRTSAQPQIFASDKDRPLCTALSRTVASAGLSPAVKVQCRDFFDLQLPPGIQNPGLVVLNPPYGRRLGTGQEGQERIRAIGTKLLGTFPGWRLGLLVPHKHWLRTLPFDLRTHPLQHGGLRLLLAVGTIPAPT